MNRLRLRAEGFTLIELLVVIAIIGILAAIAIPQFAAYRRRAFESEALSASRNMATAQEAYYVTKNEYAVTEGTLQGYGFNQSSDIDVTKITQSGSAFKHTVVDTRCTGGGGTYEYDSATGKNTLTARCD